MYSFLNKGIWSGTVLKLIAVVSMTIDHIGFILFPQYIWLRWLGRLAFPVFAYMIAEGCFYTKNKGRYIGMVFGIGVLCQAAMLIFAGSWQLNIMFTLGLSIALIFSLQWAMGRKKVFQSPEEKEHSAYSGSRGSAAGWAVFVLLLLFCIFLDYGLTRFCPGFKLDYGLFGILLPVVICIAPEKYSKLAAAAVCMAVLCLARGSSAQWFSLFALIPLALYNGKPGRYRMKYFFYLYYPVHLGILWGIWFLLH